METNSQPKADAEIDDLLCDLYAYVDEHRAAIEDDANDLDEDTPEAREERILKDRILRALEKLRTRHGRDASCPLG